MVLEDLWTLENTDLQFSITSLVCSHAQASKKSYQGSEVWDALSNH